MVRRLGGGICAVLVGIGVGSTMVGAADIKVMATAALRPAYLELVPVFEKQTGHKVTTIWGGTLDVTKRIGRGEADLGFQQVSELMHVKGIEYLGPLPAEIQHVTVFSAGLHASAKEPEAAKALVKFFTTPEAAAVIRKTGMEPG